MGTKIRLEIEWSEKAEVTFESNIAYLQEHWDEKVIKKFVDKLNNTLDNLRSFPHLGRVSNLKRARIITRHKHVLLVFRLIPDKNLIRLVVFLNTKKNSTQRYL